MHPVILSERGPLALYDFLGPDDVERYRFAGQLPWWTSPELSMRFFRPLSSLDLALDHWLLDGGGLLSHLHGALWYGALLVLAYRLYSALLDRHTALFATPLYALAGWHTMSLAFIAARHAIITAVFALWSFYVFVRADAAPRRGRWLTAVLFSLALLAGEGALLCVPLMLGWGVVRLGVVATLARLAPTLALTAAHTLAYGAAGLGARGSSLYLDPLSLAFAAELPARWISLVADMLGSLATDTTLLGARPVQVVWGLLALASAAIVLRWQMRRDPTRGKVLLGLLCGSLVAMIPASAAMPGGRTLMVIGLSGGALFGTVLSRLAEPGSKLTPWQSRLLFGWVCAFGVGLHPVFRAVLSWDLQRLGTDIVALSEELSRRCSDGVVLAAGTLDLNIGFANYVLAARQLPAPRAVHVLSMAPGQHTLTQTGERQFELKIDGDFYASLWSRNHSNEPLRAGMTAQLRDLDVALLATEPATHLRLELSDGVEPCWVTSGDDGLNALPFEPPTSSWVPGP